MNKEIYFTFKGYKFKKTAKYDIKAKVLSRKNYSDDFAILSPTNLLLGWGNMSDEKNIETIDAYQRDRWYYSKFEHKDILIGEKEIAQSLANTHIIPANENIEKELESIIKGNIVEMSGYLVNIKGEKDSFWNSSISRSDTGGGACEVFYVESIKVLQL